MTDEPQNNIEEPVVEEQQEVVDDRLLRLAADFENYKKRAAREREEYVALANERLLKEHRDKVDEPEASTIEGRIMELRTALQGDDLGDIRAKTEALQEASHKLAEAVYAQATAQAQSSATGGDGSTTTAEDEVVEEGEYEVVDDK